MKNNETITILQIIFLLITAIGLKNQVIVIPPLFKEAGRDAWTVIATSSVATFTLVSRSLHGFVSILRFFLFCSSFLGLFGFFIALFLIVFYAANIQTFGLAVAENFEVKRSIFRLPDRKYIETKGENITFHATIAAKGMINEILQEVDQQFIVNELKKKIKNEVMRTYKKALEIDSDIYRLSEQLYRKNLKTWKKVEKDGKIPLDEKSLQVEVNIDLIDSKLNKTEPIIE